MGIRSSGAPLDWAFRQSAGRYLLYELVVVLEVGVLEEDQIVVLVAFDAVLAESVCALVARPFNFLSLVAKLFAVGNRSLAGWLDVRLLGSTAQALCLLA